MDGKGGVEDLGPFLPWLPLSAKVKTALFALRRLSRLIPHGRSFAPKPCGTEGAPIACPKFTGRQIANSRERASIIDFL